MRNVRFLICLFAVLSLCSCGKDKLHREAKKFIGVWSLNGEPPERRFNTFTGEQQLNIDYLSDVQTLFIFEFNKDGTCTKQTYFDIYVSGYGHTLGRYFNPKNGNWSYDNYDEILTTSFGDAWEIVGFFDNSWTGVSLKTKKEETYYKIKSNLGLPEPDGLELEDWL